MGNQALPSEQACGIFVGQMGSSSSPPPWVFIPSFTHCTNIQGVLPRCPSTVLETGDKRRLPGPAQRNSHSRVRDGHVTSTALAFWAICSTLRTFATHLCRGCGEGEVREASQRALPPGPILLTSWLYLCISPL